jgi:hypothetical protein
MSAAAAATAEFTHSRAAGPIDYTALRVMSACGIVQVQSKPQPTRTKLETRSAAQTAKKTIAQGVATSRKASSRESKRPAQVCLPLPAVTTVVAHISCLCRAQQRSLNPRE